MDFARALPLLGMIVVHFAIVMSADATKPAWAAQVMELLDGRAAATFVVLAGVGLCILSRRGAAASRRGFVLRGLFLLVLGFVNLTITPT